MVFNSVVFLFCFLPLSLLLYYLVPDRAKNAVLLAESLLFYCWTGVAFLPLIAILIAFNYLWGLLTARARTTLRGLLPLAAVLAALAVWGIARARRTPADTVRAEFRALYKKMCRCGLSEGVSSDQEEFKQFLREHTKTAAPQDVETLLALVQTAQFAPGPVSAQTAQQVRGLCRILRKNLHR